MSKLQNFEKMFSNKPTPRPTPRPPTKSKIPEVILDIFKNLDENLDKAWGQDNAFFRKNGKSKYTNLWRDWTRFKKWFNENHKI